MRTTVVYIVRLLVDENEPDALRGVLREVNSGEEYAFSSEQGLLELLRLQPGRTPEMRDIDQIN
jgi:hypothetical protein